MVALMVLRVFVGRDGVGGNPLGVVLEGSAVAEERRQALAANLGYSETVFVDDPAAGQVRIFTPAFELPFAGHSLVVDFRSFEAAELHTASQQRALHTAS